VFVTVHVLHQDCSRPDVVNDDSNDLVTMYAVREKVFIHSLFIFVAFSCDTIMNKLCKTNTELFYEFSPSQVILSKFSMDN
jgi:hypothetical protein